MIRLALVTLVAAVHTIASASITHAAQGDCGQAVGGIVTELRKRKSKKGQWWASLQLEDLEGHVETLVFPKTYEASQALLENGRALLVTGRVENEEGRVRLTADDVMVLDDAREKKAQAVQVRLEDGDLEEATLRRLRHALEGSPGELPVYLEVVRPGRYRMVARAEPSLRVGPSKRLPSAVEEVLGPGRLRYRARVMGYDPDMVRVGTVDLRVLLGVSGGHACYLRPSS